jgi:hypothetical protein
MLVRIMVIIVFISHRIGQNGMAWPKSKYELWSVDN